MKKISLILLSLVLMFGLVACTQAADTPTDTPADTVAEPAEQIELTLEELAEFDGQDGQPAYVAVDGIIYDVSDSSFWSGGGHNGFQAGRDLTQEIKEDSPHGVANLERVPAIGRLVD